MNRQHLRVSRARYSVACARAAELVPLFGVAVGVGENCADPTASTGAHLCPEGYWCDLVSGDTPVCRTPFLAGEDCFNSNAACEPGYVCGRPDGTWRCTQPKVVSVAGAPCDDREATTEEYGWCNGFLGLTCEDGTCKSYLDGDVGDACVGVDVLRTMSCRDGLYCDTTDKCASPLPDGAACTEGSTCAGSCSTGSAEQSECVPALCME